MSNTRKLWLGLAALLVASFSVLLWAGGEIFRAAPPMPEKVLTAGRPRRLHPRRHRDRAARSGNRSAACSWARSGATAATSRRTGAPTGCIAKRSTCSTTGRAATAAPPATRSCRAEQQAALARPPAADDARQHLRPATQHDHADAGPRHRAVATSPRITRACSATTRRRPSCAKPMR